MKPKKGVQDDSQENTRKEKGGAKGIDGGTAQQEEGETESTRVSGGTDASRAGGTGESERGNEPGNDGGDLDTGSDGAPDGETVTATIDTSQAIVGDIVTNVCPAGDPTPDAPPDTEEAGTEAGQQKQAPDLLDRFWGWVTSAD